MQKSIKKIIIASGYFNPLHIGHINLLRDAKGLGDLLVVIVNNDGQVKIKGGEPFMPEKERMEIIRAVKYVDEVFLSIDGSACQEKSLEALAKKYKGRKLIFAKGGDRNKSNLPAEELKVCRDFGIKIIDNVGGKKVQSSSWLLRKSPK
jgi:cytidyltransferase-like protein